MTLVDIWHPARVSPIHQVYSLALWTFFSVNIQTYLDDLLREFLELVKPHLIKHLLLKLQHFMSVKGHPLLCSSFRHDQRTLWRWKLSYLVGNGEVFLVIHLGIFLLHP